MKYFVPKDMITGLSLVPFSVTTLFFFETVLFMTPFTWQFSLKFRITQCECNGTIPITLLISHDLQL